MADYLAPYSTELRAAIGPRYKLIRHGDGTEEIYDLVNDPHEVLSLNPDDVDPELLERLRRAVIDDIGVPAPTGGSTDQFENPEAQAQIRAMGYAGEDE